MQTPDPATAAHRYFARIYREEPEARRFYRHVLRRRSRATLIHAGSLDAFTVERSISQITNAVFVMADPMEPLGHDCDREDARA